MSSLISRSTALSSATVRSTRAASASNPSALSLRAPCLATADPSACSNSSHISRANRSLRIAPMMALLLLDMVAVAPLP
jgi:hypothetical protein